MKVFFNALVVILIVSVGNLATPSAGCSVSKPTCPNVELA